MLTQTAYQTHKRRLSIHEGRMKRAAAAPPLNGNWGLPIRGESDPRIPHLRAIIRVCNEAFEAFDAAGSWPDDWSRWDRAREDAQWKLRQVDDL